VLALFRETIAVFCDDDAHKYCLRKIHRYRRITEVIHVPTVSTVPYSVTCKKTLL